MLDLNVSCFLRTLNVAGDNMRSSQVFGVVDGRYAIIRFKGRFRFLSNYYLTEINYEGLVYPSSEHAYAAAKTDVPYLKQCIAKMNSPAEAKKFGRSVKLFEDWDEIKDRKMYEILKVKFKKNSILGDKLEKLDYYLVEGNTWHDNYWGCCFCDECSEARDITGEKAKNKLGRLLMKIRKELHKID